MKKSSCFSIQLMFIAIQPDGFAQMAARPDDGILNRKKSHYLHGDLPLQWHVDADGRFDKMPCRQMPGTLYDGLFIFYCIFANKILFYFLINLFFEEI
ncbi:hypothetical protein JXO59_08770 [candidate division KSB1 bacterium]|nr:hypothetical protein [candidate division KSB1 bacterium]